MKIAQVFFFFLMNIKEWYQRKPNIFKVLIYQWHEKKNYYLDLCYA